MKKSRPGARPRATPSAEGGKAVAAMDTSGARGNAENSAPFAGMQCAPDSLELAYACCAYDPL